MCVCVCACVCVCVCVCACVCVCKKIFLETKEETCSSAFVLYCILSYFKLGKSEPASKSFELLILFFTVVSVRFYLPQSTFFYFQ